MDVVIEGMKLKQKLDNERRNAALEEMNKMQDNQMAASKEEPHPLDPQKLKRVTSKGQPSQSARNKKDKKLLELEAKHERLSMEVKMLPVLIAESKKQGEELRKENEELKGNISMLEQLKCLNDAKIEAQWQDLEQLRQLYTWQQHLKEYEQKLCDEQAIQQVFSKGPQSPKF